MSSISFSLSGTAVAADLANAKLYTTAGRTFVLASATLIPSSSVIANPYTLTLTTAATLGTGANYFWLTFTDAVLYQLFRGVARGI